MKVFSFETLPDKEKITFHWDEANGEIVFVTESRIFQDDWSVSNKICIPDVLFSMSHLWMHCVKQESDVALSSLVLHRKSIPSHQFLDPTPTLLLQPVTNCESISPSVREIFYEHDLSRCPLSANQLGLLDDMERLEGAWELNDQSSFTQSTANDNVATRKRRIPRMGTSAIEGKRHRLDTRDENDDSNLLIGPLEDKQTSISVSESDF